jgi:hypothetical protein
MAMHHVLIFRFLTRNPRCRAKRFRLPPSTQSGAIPSIVRIGGPTVMSHALVVATTTAVRDFVGFVRPHRAACLLSATQSPPVVPNVDQRHGPVHPSRSALLIEAWTKALICVVSPTLDGAPLDFQALLFDFVSLFIEHPVQRNHLLKRRALVEASASSAGGFVVQVNTALRGLLGGQVELGCC